VSDPVADALRSCAFAHPLRTHQQLALDAATDGRNYLFLPPGAGKTVVGWEAARRLGQRILVLTPNTAVQDQWAQTWQRDFGPGPDAVCGADRSLASPVTVLTYQSLAVLDRETVTGRTGGTRSGEPTGPRCWTCCIPTAGT
jgi:superfamily II DNA or RNA helicase